jgi:hypothetical protein
MLKSGKPEGSPDLSGRRRRFESFLSANIQSGVALRLPPHSKFYFGINNR